MPTPHIESKKGEIAELVLMPGDPLRAKYIAENYLEDYKLVNKVRNMFAYTGKYKGKRITVFASGMGIPSIGIYSYELFKFYDVKKIIRLGTSGSFSKNIHVLDVVLAEGSYARSYFDQLIDNNDINYCMSSEKLNNTILEIAKEKKIPIKYGKIITSDVFDLYTDSEYEFRSNYPDDVDFLAVEMEAFGLLYVANKFGREASCLTTVVDSLYDKKSVTREDRIRKLDDEISIALDAIIK